MLSNGGEGVITTVKKWLISRFTSRFSNGSVVAICACVSLSSLFYYASHTASLIHNHSRSEASISATSHSYWHSCQTGVKLNQPTNKSVTVAVYILICNNIFNRSTGMQLQGADLLRNCVMLRDGLTLLPNFFTENDISTDTDYLCCDGSLMYVRGCIF